METYGYVYLVRNRANGKVYVGQTIQSVIARWKQHIRDSRKNQAFQNAIRKYGPDAFTVEALATCADRDTLDKLERYFITEVFQSTNPILGYNLMSGGGSRGRASDSTKSKLSESHLGKAHSPETRARMSAAHKGRPKSVEHRNNIAAGKRTAEAREKMSSAHKGRSLSPEHRAKLSAAHKGKKLSPEHVMKLKNRKYSTETLLRFRDAARTREERKTRGVLTL